MISPQRHRDAEFLGQNLSVGSVSSVLSDFFLGMSENQSIERTEGTEYTEQPHVSLCVSVPLWSKSAVQGM
jgi:hypothetical protein